jgi:NADPH:quinone reductase-like Zn-dependent oxidoreductase
MKAIVQDRYGAPDLLRLQEIGAPVAGEHEVLVRVRASSVHPDVWHAVHGVPYALRLMGSGVRAPKYHVPGTDVAGVVEAVGPGVTRFRAGDEVFGETLLANLWRNGGAYAELATAHEDVLEAKPTGLTFEQAGVAPNAAKIAVQGLRDEGWIQAGHRVLIVGAGGGVGTAAVQLAKAWGAAEVTGVDAPGKLVAVRSIGADRVIDPHERGLHADRRAVRPDPRRGGDASLLGDPTGAHPRGDVRDDRPRSLRAVRPPVDRQSRPVRGAAPTISVRPTPHGPPRRDGPRRSSPCGEGPDR